MKSLKVLYKNALHIIIVVNSLTYGRSIGIYAGDGMTLIGIKGEYALEDVDGGEIHTNSVGLSYIHNGNIEISGKYDISRVEDDMGSQFNYIIKGHSYAGYYHFKNNPNFPFDLRIGALFGNSSASGNWLNDLGYSLQAKLAGLGSCIYRSVYQKKNAFIIIGFLEFHVINNQTTMINSYGKENNNQNNYHSTNFGLTINNGKLFFAPSIGNIDGAPLFNCSLGVLIKSFSQWE